MKKNTASEFHLDKIESRKSKISGIGAFAIKPIKARIKIGNMTGELISTREARKRVKSLHVIKMVEFDERVALDATHSNSLSHINHSCDANCYIRLIHHKVEFYAKRDIKKGEELTADYGETQHDEQLKCMCGAKNCRGWL